MLLILIKTTDYKQFIKLQINENRHIRGYQGQLALAAGCQRSFLSQVLNGPVQLTPDHAAGMGVFWNFDESETEYFIQLVHLSRAGSLLLRRAIEKRLQAIRKSGEDLSHRLGQPQITNEQNATLYYSEWSLSAIHILLGISSYQTTTSIATRLQIPEPLAIEYLSQLMQMKLIEKKGNRWIITERSIHSPQNSIHSLKHHSNWRTRALINAQKNLSNSVHYTALHTLSCKDLERIKEVVDKLILSTRAIVEPSPAEELCCLNIDYFKV